MAICKNVGSGFQLHQTLVIVSACVLLFLSMAGGQRSYGWYGDESNDAANYNYNDNYGYNNNNNDEGAGKSVSITDNGLWKQFKINKKNKKIQIGIGSDGSTSVQIWRQKECNDWGVYYHNYYRQIHNAGPLMIDSELTIRATQCAEHYANIGEIDHSCPYKADAGENLAWKEDVYTPDAREAMKDTVSRWYNEVSGYNYNDPDWSSGTGHFSQLVWRETTRLGIGYKTVGQRYYIVALYDPAGNVVGQFRSNVQ